MIATVFTAWAILIAVGLWLFGQGRGRRGMYAPCRHAYAMRRRAYDFRRL